MPKLIWVFAGCTCNFIGLVMHILICLSDFSLSENRLYVNKGQELKSSQCHTYITNNGLVYMNVIHTFVEERRLKGNAFISYYDKCLILLTNFVALLWTFSIAIISFFCRGKHTVTAYSRWGRTTDLYKFRNISLTI